MRKSFIALTAAAAVSAAFGFWSLVVYATEPSSDLEKVVKTTTIQPEPQPASEFQKAVSRVKLIRKAGLPAGGKLAALSPVKISEADYWLMGCDSSSARRNNPDIPAPKLLDGAWYAGGSDLNESHFLNIESTSNDGGKTWHIDAFYNELPKAQYWSAPEEVVWHCLRVRELRAQGVPLEQRISTMTMEAKAKPWEQMQ